MKKLIALTAASVMASSAAVAAVSLSGTASVTYDDNGSAPSSTSYAASLVIAGSNGATSGSATLDLLTGNTSNVSMTTSIGPVSVAVDMTDDAETAPTATVDERGVTLSIDVLAGDVAIALDDSGSVTVSSTVAGIDLTHAIGGTTKASATLAGMDVNVARTAAGATTWDVSTTLNGVTLKVDSASKVTASMGLAGNKVTITNGSNTTVKVERDLTSGASLTATYDTTDDSLTLKASVSF